MERDSKKFRDFIKNYWRHYRELEDEFISIRRYVDFQKDNFGTYSVEFLKLYQAICSEIDVIGKAMAVELDSSFKPDDGKNNIYKWWYMGDDIVINVFSVNQRDQLIQRIYTKDRIKPTGSKIYYVVDQLSVEIQKEKQIQFKYTE